MIKIYKYGEVSNEEVFARDNIASNVEPAVTAIIADVRSRGDEALFEYTTRFDKAQLTSLEVSPAEIDEAFETVEPQFLDILREAAANIRLFHEKQVRNSFVINRDGVVNQLDITRAQRHYGSDNEICDVNDDGEVDIEDLILIRNNYTV